MAYTVCQENRMCKVTYNDKEYLIEIDIYDMDLNRDMKK